MNAGDGDAAGGTLVLVGCGQMGSAMLRGWLEAARPRDFSSSSRRALRSELAGATGVSWHRDGRRELPDALLPDAVVFAVKPQIIDAVVPAYRRWVRAADGVPVDRRRYDDRPVFVGISGDAAIVRAMPNTPAAIGRAITVACAIAR